MFDFIKDLDMKHGGLFAAGFLLGTAGLKILASDDAKYVYANVAAAALRAKDCVMKTATNIQENAEDIYEEAKAINRDRQAMAEGFYEYEDLPEEEVVEDTEE